MSESISRREAITRFGTASAGALIGVKGTVAGQAGPAAPGSHLITVAGHRVELSVTVVSPQTLRLSLLPVMSRGTTRPIDDSLVLIKQDWPMPVARVRSVSGPQTIIWGNRRVVAASNPLSVEVQGSRGKIIQRLQVSAESGAVTFSSGDAPLFGLGEGGHQFDRRGTTYSMNHGQDEPHFEVLGARMSIPWLVSPEGWALFFHRPFGSFDLTGERGQFEPLGSQGPLPLDVFLVAAEDPPQLFREYARLTGFPHLPPIWALGYQQSHRTLASREEVLSEARTFREKKLPCDVLIYLGTGFCPSGWNTGHGSFTFNNRVFPDPAAMIQEMHREDFKIVLHVVPQCKDLHGSVKNTRETTPDSEDAACYWAEHVPDFRLGVDGWWPDEGDWLSPTACLVRNRMYWEGPQLERPNFRPYALHRNGYAGIQRYGWLWSGDIASTWESLRAQVSVGINTGLSGMPFWGTDTGGFVTTPELTGELYVRWFQFSAFCPLFRSHGRTWKLRLPWGWNTGDYGPTELEGYHGNAALPDPKELHNLEVESICRKYLNLRYRLMPYLCSVVREAHDTGLPIMRALWLHYPDDPHAVERGDQYLWGPAMLVAPVMEKGATSRRLYLPRGAWYDFWTEEKLEGGCERSRKVDLAAMPLYARAGAILPTGPVRQYGGEKTNGALELTVYPGANGDFALYEDDGITFNHERGEFTRLRIFWNDRDRQLTLSLMEGSRMFESLGHKFVARVASSEHRREIVFSGNTQTVQF